MKKIISLLLSVIMLLSISVMGATAANAEEKNLCEEFEELEDLVFWYGGTSPYDLFAMLWRVQNVVPDFDDNYWDKEEGDGYDVPADVLDGYVNRLFVLEKDLSTLVEEESKEEYPFITYNKEADEYHFFLGGWGDFTYYHDELIGYTDDGDTYSVYLQRVSDEFENLDELLEGSGYTEEELGDRLIVTPDGKYSIALTEEEQRNTKMTVSFDGELTKVIKSELVETIPDDSDLILPGTVIKPDTSVDYDVPDGVTVDGDAAFPENTVVKVEKVEKGEIFERAEKSLSDIADADKIAVFEFTATADNAQVQPNGKVRVSFDLPANLSAENLKMFYVAEDGKTEEVKITVDAKNKTVAAELEHFSTYVLCNVKAGSSTDVDDGDSETVVPPAGDSSNVAVLSALMFASAAALTVLTYTKKKQHGN